MTKESKRSNNDNEMDKSAKNYQPWPQEHRTSSTDLQSFRSSQLVPRSTKTAMKSQSVKTRGFVGSDKLKWDGDPSIFDMFTKELEGILLKLGMGYLFDFSVQQAYLDNRLLCANSKAFYLRHRITVPQMQHDLTYLYDLLMTATKEFVKSAISGRPL